MCCDSLISFNLYQVPDGRANSCKEHHEIIWSLATNSSVNKGWFTRSSFGPIVIEIFLCLIGKVGVHTIEFSHPVIIWCELLRDTTILVLRIYAHFTAAFSSSSGHHFVKIFRRIERGKIKNWRLFSNWMCSIFIQCTKNVGNLLKIGVHKSNCCLKSGLKNNWTKKLEMM